MDNFQKLFYLFITRNHVHEDHTILKLHLKNH
jgi:hypothetical protein